MKRSVLFLFSILAIMVYGSLAESKPRLIDKLVVSLKKVPGNKWEVNQSSAEIRLKVGKIFIDITRDGFLYINYVSIVIFDQRAQKIYRKIVKHKYKDLLILKALKALGEVEGKQNVSGTIGTQHRKP